VPKTAQEFAEYWRRSDDGKRNAAAASAALSNYEKSAGETIDRFEHSAKIEKAKHVSPKSKYVISYPMQVRLAMKRRYQMAMGDAATTMIVTIAAIVQALIIGSVYFQVSLEKLD
jgi:ATP-binding cassette subfamily G (WHITE) protein 2 (SNQ2)